ncbi:hypothetical protein AGMMS5026_01920 [Endomicrobiia bacterium]|nr:hypothetical protein AGMMS49523_07770 [Endomicrobiia bacterium]GHT12452.1 hypothetical protein AGMMS49571_04450 [Endomicrobiia bacterium]GHT20024.1 hypothetical protein AGMMS49929_05270 [Endomicrobiia bacterium]GHT27136.1 hypothetical protein AGMMS49995_05400 [Endomicrobiia bacterium]GHT29762.1 hypothetical protein AGMMS5026_01920 [Endomicrobiia bacterium]
MSPPDQLFGVNESGLPKVVLSDLPDTPRQDVILPICYRGTKYALTVAHALGFGIYRNKGLVQLFDDTGLWEDIGYATISGNFDSAGKEIRLKRKDDCSPNFFDKCKVSESAMQCITFKDKEEQYDWLLEDIKYNLENEEIEEDDILIILTDPLTGYEESRTVVKKLLEHNLKSYIVGITNDREIIFIEKSIAISSIYRAKGNEAPLVYVLNSQSCFDGVELTKKRNILFTAITRSRAWVNILGYNEVDNDMDELYKEVQKVIDKKFIFEFIVPTKEEAAKLRIIHKDRPHDSKERIRKGKACKKFLDGLDEDEKDLVGYGRNYNE